MNNNDAIVDEMNNEEFEHDDDEDAFATALTNCLSSIEAHRKEAQANLQTAINFLGTVFNADRETLGTVIIAKKLGRGFAHYGHENIADAANEAVRISGFTSDAYFAPALFKDFNPTATKGNRVSEKAVGAHTFWLDIDVGDEKVQEGKGYATQQEALEALRDFCAATGLPRPPLIISSGYGVHTYWLMSEFVPRERWLEAARMLKALTIAHKLLVDQKRTADIASVLRPVGTRNFKNPAMPQTVAALHPRTSAPPKRFSLATFKARLDAAVHALPQADERGRRRDAATGTTSSATAGPRPTPKPETPENIDWIQSMLNAIDPDTDRETWLKACWGALATGWDCAEKLIRDWSERGKKFEETDFKKVVDSFDPARTDGIGVGTLVHIAREHGWQDDPGEPLATAKGRRDIANGQRFAEKFHNKLLWLADEGNWLEFDPQIGWRPAPDGAADCAAMSIVDEMRVEARTKKQNAEVDRTSLLRGLRAMIEIAKSMPGMSARLSDFDKDPMVIGLQNGIFNLDRWELEPPAPERKVLKRANVVYDPNADCPRFLKFLKEVQPDKEVRRFLRIFMGYCLTGLTREHVFIYLDGDGRNGKGTFIEMMAWVLGAYAHKIPTEMLMTQQRNSQAPSPDIMLLKGVRFAFANETEEGKRLDEARVKDLTGGDTQTARTPHAKAFIQFPPTHKLAISGSYKPEVRDNSTGMWERMILVSWNVTFAKDNPNRDTSLGSKLKAEGSGVLNWLLAGLADYQANGLKAPRVIQAATAAYRSEQDLIGEWLRDNCISREEIETTLGAPWLAAELAKQLMVELQEGKRSLYSDYNAWAKASGYIPVSQKRLTRQLGKHGYPIAPDHRSITGITLRTSPIGQAYNKKIEEAAKAKAAKAAKAGASGGGQVIGLPVKQRQAPDQGGAGAASVPANSTLAAELAEVAKIVDGAPHLPRPGLDARTPDVDARTGFEELAAPDEALE
jgi:putative DNA primase/helicase